MRMLVWSLASIAMSSGVGQQLWLWFNPEPGNFHSGMASKAKNKQKKGIYFLSKKKRKFWQHWFQISMGQHFVGAADLLKQGISFPSSLHFHSGTSPAKSHRQWSLQLLPPERWDFKETSGAIVLYISHLGAYSWNILCIGSKTREKNLLFSQHEWDKPKQDWQQTCF